MIPGGGSEPPEVPRQGPPAEPAWPPQPHWPSHPTASSPTASSLHAPGQVPPPGYLGPYTPPAGWAPPQPVPAAVVDPGGRPYPQLLRGPRMRWWRPLVSLLVLLASALVVGGAAGVLYLLYALATGRLDSGGADSDLDAWSVTPIGLLANNLLLAALIPLAQVAIWVGFGWRPRWLASVAGRIRWGWLGRCLVVSIVVMGGLTLALVLLSGGLDVSLEGSWPALAVVVLLTTPLQAAGEEYLFRGWIPQTVGSLFGRPVVGALVGCTLSTTLFALAHGQQDPWLFADRFGFGVVACYLVWRTGGLEAGITLHAANNLVAFGLAIVSGQLQDSVTTTESDPISLVVDLVTLVIAAGLILVLARRRRLPRLFAGSPGGAGPEGSAAAPAGPGGAGR